MKIILDPGSCHMGKLDRALELVRVAAGSGADAVKFQLLTPAQAQGGNIILEWDLLPEVMDLGERLGIEVFASVFNHDGALWLQKCGAQSIKFSYSKSGLLNDSRIRDIADSFNQVYVSMDTMTPPISLPGFTSLYCIPEYPVRYMVDFEGLFPRFDGFSSHCLGIEQDLRAKKAGAVILEKHFTLDRSDITCPDHNFALKPKQAEALCRRAKEKA